MNLRAPQPEKEAVTAAQLARERRTNKRTPLSRVRREPRDGAHDGRRRAEIVTWREGLFSYRGILVDPTLANVPIEAEGWCRWWCRQKLIGKHEDAKEFGEAVAYDLWCEGAPTDRFS